MYLNMRIFDIGSSTEELIPHFISLPFDEEFIDTLNEINEESTNNNGVSISEEIEVSLRSLENKISVKIPRLSEEMLGKLCILWVNKSRIIVYKNYFLWKGIIFFSDGNIHESHTTPMHTYRINRLYKVSRLPFDELPLYIDDYDPWIINCVKERLRQ